MTPPPSARPAATAHARWLVVAARFHGTIVDRLLEGALGALEARGIGGGEVGVVRVPGAYELPQAAMALARAAGDAGRSLRGIVALGVVIRGETPHFEHVCTAAAHGLMDVGLRTGVPVGFGVLTCDDAAQALARAGGDRGNKGAEAALAALELAEALDASRGPAGG